ncbi:hypothetical protein AGDE_12892 [Angomonas deanei]|uniref:Uncharacterized protein n=1 Tax=Angomonas deanei TaxID=59799 RepID=A0A7G2C188_9TRYP|nr:hypothetical protein AGDE_12892 [Angomonas deanei]CAD2213396.1 hypothetical protein, conserved [Angomonas deanei]|eukprot:EPY23327.1 hypothetical protein AGDE_12892 [Angomonas deanei]
MTDEDYPADAATLLMIDRSTVANTRQFTLRFFGEHVPNGVKPSSRSPYRFLTPTLEESSVLTSVSALSLQSTPANLTTQLSEANTPLHHRRDHHSSGLNLCDMIGDSPLPVRPTVVGEDAMLLCRATSNRIAVQNANHFPWKRYMEFLYANRVGNFLCLQKKSERAVEEGEKKQLLRGYKNVIFCYYQEGVVYREHMLHLVSLIEKTAVIKGRRKGDIQCDWITMECLHTVGERTLKVDSFLDSKKKVVSSFAELSEQVNNCARYTTPLCVLQPFREFLHYSKKSNQSSNCFLMYLFLYMEVYFSLGFDNAALLRLATVHGKKPSEKLLLCAVQQLTQNRELSSQNAEMAVNLVSPSLRQRATTEGGAWMKTFILTSAVSLTKAASELERYRQECLLVASPADSHALALAYFVLGLTCSSETTAVEALSRSLVLAPFAHLQSAILLRMADVYMDDTKTSVALPTATSARSVATRLLQIAVSVHPANGAAHVSLAKLYRQHRHNTNAAHELLSRYIKYCFKWSREGFTYVPSAIYVSRSQCMKKSAVSDAETALTLNPRCSFSYQLLAARHMDRRRLEAADEELKKILLLTLQVSDIAIRCRFLVDSINFLRENGATRAASQLHLRYQRLCGLMVLLSMERNAAEETLTPEMNHSILVFLQTIDLH